VRIFTAFLLLLSGFETLAQLAGEEPVLFDGLRSGAALPEKLLSTRSAVIYPYEMTAKELRAVQQSFQQTGIDAIAYFDIDLVLAGKDVTRALTFYFNKRNVVNLIFFRKTVEGYSVLVTGFNAKETLVEESQPAWQADDPKLEELLKKVHRLAANNLLRENFLINDHPEMDLQVNPIAGRRSDFFAIDLKVDQLAVPKSGVEAIDSRLAELFSAYPFKYKLTEPGLSERELHEQGFLYVLCFIHTRGTIARELLGYDVSKPESAFVSVTFPGDQAQFRNIPAEIKVYKFYVKHIGSGNVFLGTKWDADTSWDQALKNHLMAFKSELKVN
jgi:hypothetical protein